MIISYGTGNPIQKDTLEMHHGAYGYENSWVLHKKHQLQKPCWMARKHTHTHTHKMDRSENDFIAQGWPNSQLF